MKNIRIALTIFCFFLLLLGVIYPLAITFAAQTFFPYQANGSMIVSKSSSKNILLGSELIGQSFSDPKYFWSRISSTSAHPYDSSASSGSNYSATNPKLIEAAKARLEALGLEAKNLPSDLLTSSASGLDPDISPASAYAQVARVAKARGIDQSKMEALVKSHTEDRFIGLLGEARVNVLKLNLDLDAWHEKH